MDIGPTNPNASLVAPDNLRAQVHSQICDYLAIAEKSTKPEIVAFALREAAADSAHLRKQEVRLSPRLAVTVTVLYWLAALGAGIYAIYNALEEAVWIVSLLIIIGLLITAISLTLSNYLSQENLMKVLGWAKDWKKPGDLTSLSAGGELEQSVLEPHETKDFPEESPKSDRA